MELWRWLRGRLLEPPYFRSGLSTSRTRTSTSTPAGPADASGTQTARLQPGATTVRGVCYAFVSSERRGGWVQTIVRALLVRRKLRKAGRVTSNRLEERGGGARGHGMPCPYCENHLRGDAICAGKSKNLGSEDPSYIGEIVVSPWRIGQADRASRLKRPINEATLGRRE